MNITTRIAGPAVLLAGMPEGSRHPRLVDGAVAYRATDQLPKGAKAVALLEASGALTVLDPVAPLTAATLRAAQELLETRAVTRAQLQYALAQWAAWGCTLPKGTPVDATASRVVLEVVLTAPLEELELLTEHAATDPNLAGLVQWREATTLPDRVAILTAADVLLRALIIRLDQEAGIEAMAAVGEALRRV